MLAARPLRSRNLPLQHFNKKGLAHAASDAEGGKTIFESSSLHLVEKGCRDARARRADGVAEGNAAAVDIRDVPVEPQELFAGQVLRGKGLVELDQLHILDLHISSIEELPDGGDGTVSHELRLDGGHLVVDDSRDGFQVQPYGRFRRHDDEAGRAVIDAAGVAGSHGAVLLEGGLEPGQNFGSCVGSRVLVRVADRYFSFFPLYFHGNDFILEPAFPGSRRSPHLAR